MTDFRNLPIKRTQNYPDFENEFKYEPANNCKQEEEIEECLKCEKCGRVFGCCGVLVSTNK